MYLTTGKTASCHRTNHHKFDYNSFDFHNTPNKIQDRQDMLEGLWPKRGCEYCRDIEQAGGASDRITNLDFWQFDPPTELVNNPYATNVTPRILEVYFNNTCNLKCTYCGPYFSSLWNDELRRFGDEVFVIDKNFESNKYKCFEWLRNNVSELHQFNFLGGEPLYQQEFDELLDLLDNHPAPNLTLAFSSNLAVSKNKLVEKIDRIEKLIEQGKIKRLLLTASLDCWGSEQEYARFPIRLDVWENNFNYVLEKPWITLTIGSTVTPLTIKSLHVLMDKINTWNSTRPVYWYGNSVNGPDHMRIDQFGPIFNEDFQKAIDLMPEDLPERRSVKEYLRGIQNQTNMSKPNLTNIKNLCIFLNKIDQRRNTNWRSVYPWLEEQFIHHLGEKYVN